MRFAYVRDVRSSLANVQSTAGGTHTTRATISVLLLTALLLPTSGDAIDRSLCSDDGVTETPSFAAGRDQDQCLLLDPGNGDLQVPFQYEFFHKYGVSGPGGPFDVGTNAVANQYGRCRTASSGEYCSYLFWDIDLDNYLLPSLRGKDTLHWSGMSGQYIYFKNTTIGNSWRCVGGAWSGPTPNPANISCPAGAADRAHTDSIQMRGQPVGGGWVIYQDSKIGQGPVYHQDAASDGPGAGIPGNFLVQGTQIGAVPDFPEQLGTNWVADCIARGETAANCPSGVMSIGKLTDETWLVDNFGPGLFSFGGNTNNQSKVVIVNSGCGSSSCGGSIEYNNGWPHPVALPGTGPSICPNGLIGNSVPTDNAVIRGLYCYTSIENALNDVSTGASSNIGDCPSIHCPHKPPPFVHLSAAGWENPPIGGNIPPPPPILISSVSPPGPEPTTAQAAVVGFALWDAQADRLVDAAFESGEQISLADNPCTAIEILGNPYLAGSGPGSVAYVFDGQDLGGCTGTPGSSFENSAPYAWEADSGPGSFECAATLTQRGSHTLTVTPFDGDNCTGHQGSPAMLRFEIR